MLRSMVLRPLSSAGVTVARNMSALRRRYPPECLCRASMCRIPRSPLRLNTGYTTMTVCTRIMRQSSNPAAGLIRLDCKTHNSLEVLALGPRCRKRDVTHCAPCPRVHTLCDPLHRHSHTQQQRTLTAHPQQLVSSQARQMLSEVPDPPPSSWSESCSAATILICFVPLQQNCRAAMW